CRGLAGLYQGLKARCLFWRLALCRRCRRCGLWRRGGLRRSRRSNENNPLLALQVVRRDDIITPHSREDNVICDVGTPGAEQVAKSSREKPQSRICDLERTIEHAGNDRAEAIAKVLARCHFRRWRRCRLRRLLGQGKSG